jgi:hypothetical protein
MSHQSAAASFIAILITLPFVIRFATFRIADLMFVKAAATIVAEKITIHSGIGLNSQIRAKTSRLSSPSSTDYLAMGTPRDEMHISNQGKNVSAFFAKLDRLSSDVAFRASAGGALFI